MTRFLLRSLKMGAGLFLFFCVYLCWMAWHGEIAHLPFAARSTSTKFSSGPRLALNVTARERSCRLLIGAGHGSVAAPFKRAETQLVFFDKPIMQVVRALCVQRHWKMRLVKTNDSAHGVVADFPSPDVFTIVFTASRDLRHRPLLSLANSSDALVSAVRYAFKVAGGKKAQLELLRAHFESYGCSLREAGVMPASFLLDDPADCRGFFEYASARPSSWWVLKTSRGYGGDGVAVFPNTTALSRRFGLCAAKAKESFIVQEYLGRPLLLEGRKFDVRALVLIASTTPYLLFHHDGYLRLSVKNFALSNDGDRAVHLTNTHVQAAVKGFSPNDHFWSYSRFQQYLDLHHPDNGDFVGSKLVPFIKKMATVILQVGEGFNVWNVHTV